MARKPSRPESEIQALADEWRSRRREGESVEAWMRRNVARLTRMVRDQGWRWDDVGRAMTLAGVTYATGRAWTPEVLRVRASEARAQLRARRVRAGETVEVTRVAPSQHPETITAAQPSQVQPPVTEQPPHRTEDAPRRRSFRTVTLPADAQAAPPKPAEPARETTPAPAAKQDADAVIRRLFGNQED